MKSRAVAAIVLSFRNSEGTGARSMDLVNLRQARVEWSTMAISEDFSPGRGEITRFHADASRASFALNRLSRGVLVISRGTHVAVKRWNVVVNARLLSTQS